MAAEKRVLRFGLKPLPPRGQIRVGLKSLFALQPLQSGRVCLHILYEDGSGTLLPAAGAEVVVDSERRYADAAGDICFDLAEGRFHATISATAGEGLFLSTAVAFEVKAGDALRLEVLLSAPLVD